MTVATRRLARSITVAFALGIGLIALVAVAGLVALDDLTPREGVQPAPLELSIRLDRERRLVDLVAVGAIVADAGIALLVGRQLVRRFDASQSAVVARERFLSSATQELARPLAVLEHELAPLRPLAQGTPEIARALAGTDGALGRLHALFAELEEANRLSSGTARLNLEPTDLARVVREVGARLTREYGRGVPLDIEAPVRVVGEWDRARLEEVVWHLVTNAVKFGHGRRIRVRVLPGERARLVVQDHGAGISRVAQTRLFEAFSRAGDPQGGLGLGLYLVRSIVAAHGGAVRVESLPGVGSRFTVELPLKPEAARERVPRFPFVRPQQA